MDGKFPSNSTAARSTSKVCPIGRIAGAFVEPSPKETGMKVKIWVVLVMAVACAIAAPGVVVALDAKPTNASASKRMVFEIKEKSEVAILLPFAAGDVTATTSGDKQTDVHLFIYDGDNKEVGKDTSPGPTCEVKFTPTKKETFKLLVKNEGPGSNKVTLDVKAPEGEDKSAEGSKDTAAKTMVFEINENSEVAVFLPFLAGKEQTVTTNGDKQTDVHLFVHDGDNQEVGKDTTPGPKCEVKFTPTKEGTFKLVVKNEGPGPNKVTLEAKVAE
jgi:hypothetical protein